MQKARQACMLARNNFLQETDNNCELFDAACHHKKQSLVHVCTQIIVHFIGSLPQKTHVTPYSNKMAHAMVPEQDARPRDTGETKACER